MPHGRTGEDVTDAQVVAMRLRQLPPHEATAEEFAACEQALALISHERGSELWCELQSSWGHLLLERREGSHAENVARARATALVCEFHLMPIVWYCSAPPGSFIEYRPDSVPLQIVCG